MKKFPAQKTAKGIQSLEIADDHFDNAPMNQHHLKERLNFYFYKVDIEAGFGI